MAEYIEREAVIKYLSEVKSVCTGNYEDETADNLSGIIREISDGEIPSADVASVKHGHIVWKEYHKGGIRRKKCLQEVNSIYIEQQMPCKHIAIIDERYLSKDPYCSGCGKLLGEFLNYCGNCGAKMDGGDPNAQM